MTLKDEALKIIGSRYDADLGCIPTTHGEILNEIVNAIGDEMFDNKVCYHDFIQKDGSVATYYVMSIMTYSNELVVVDWVEVDLG